jgi:hypothetical protein
LLPQSKIARPVASTGRVSFGDGEARESALPIRRPIRKKGLKTADFHSFGRVLQLTPRISAI